MVSVERSDSNKLGIGDHCSSLYMMRKDETTHACHSRGAFSGIWEQCEVSVIFPTQWSMGMEGKYTTMMKGESTFGEFNIAVFSGSCHSNAVIVSV